MAPCPPTKEIPVGDMPIEALHGRLAKGEYITNDTLNKSGKSRGFLRGLNPSGNTEPAPALSAQLSYPVFGGTDDGKVQVVDPRGYGHVTARPL